MYRNKKYRRSATRGGVLITTLVISTIVASMLAGLGTLLSSYYSRSVNEMNYASAINLADAGVNYEIRKISANASSADLPGSTTPLGSLVSFGNGSFRVYCTMADGTTSWDKSTSPFCIIATGISGSVSRTVQISAASSSGGGGTAGLFAIVSGTMSGSPDVNGSIATDGTLDFNGMPNITGDVIFDGPSARYINPPGCGAPSTISNPNAVSWPTVSNVALSLFPATGATAPGGLAYLATHNDNLLAVPPILGTTISLSGSSTVSLVGKPGGSNYYLTSLTASGNSGITFNNLLGPITVWVGPAGGSGTFTLTGGTATVKMATDPTKAVRIYVATTSGASLTGKSELDAGVYNVTGGTSTLAMSGNSSIYGTVIADKFTFSGNTTVNATSGYFTPSGVGNYLYNNAWVEKNGM